MAGRIEPGSGSGAATGHLGGSTVFGFGGVLADVFEVVFEGALLDDGRDRALAESEAGRCAEAVETQRSQAKDARTPLAARADQAWRANRLGFMYTRRGEERAERRVGIGM